MKPYSEDELRASGQLQRYAEQRRKMEDAILMSVLRCRALEMTWSRIGYALGTSGQAAWERYGLTPEQKEQRARQLRPTFDQPKLEDLESLGGKLGERLEPRKTNSKKRQHKKS